MGRCRGRGGEISGREKTGYTVVPFNGLYDVGMERGLFINMRTVVPDQFPSNTCWYPRSYPDAGEIFNTISDRCYPPRCIDDNVLAFFLETEKEREEDGRRYIQPRSLSVFSTLSFFLFPFFSTCPCSNGKRDGGPKNKSIILGRLVHLFPTLHNIPLGGLRTLFLLIALSLFYFILLFTFAFPVFPRDRRLKPISGKIYRLEARKHSYLADINH